MAFSSILNSFFGRNNRKGAIALRQFLDFLDRLFSHLLFISGLFLLLLFLLLDFLFILLFGFLDRLLNSILLFLISKLKLFCQSAIVIDALRLNRGIPAHNRLIILDQRLIHKEFWVWFCQDGAGLLGFVSYWIWSRRRVAILSFLFVLGKDWSSQEHITNLNRLVFLGNLLTLLELFDFLVKSVVIDFNEFTKEWIVVVKEGNE